MNTQLISMSSLKACELCPRRCNINRADGLRGVCGADDTLKISRSALHMWEEPPITGTRGSGTIFFSSCPLKCIFCQNHEISRGQAGETITIERLAACMIELQQLGAHNINLVTPTHYAPHIVSALGLARQHGLILPIVYNTSGYERPEIIQELVPFIDVWLTDFKYASNALAKKYSHAADYPEFAQKSLKVMVESLLKKGGRKKNKEGMYTQAVIVRHLVLPGHTHDSCKVLDTVWEIGQNNVDISLMNQYTPNEVCIQRGGNLSRKITNSEYAKVLTYAEDSGFSHMFWQQEGTASESFIPAFDAQGVQGPDIHHMM